MNLPIIRLAKRGWFKDLGTWLKEAGKIWWYDWGIKVFECEWRILWHYVTAERKRSYSWRVLANANDGERWEKEIRNRKKEKRRFRWWEKNLTGHWKRVVEDKRGTGEGTMKERRISRGKQEISRGEATAKVVLETLNPSNPSASSLQGCEQGLFK